MAIVKLRSVSRYSCTSTTSREIHFWVCEDGRRNFLSLKTSAAFGERPLLSLTCSHVRLTTSRALRCIYVEDFFKLGLGSLKNQFDKNERRAFRASGMEHVHLAFISMLLLSRICSILVMNMLESHDSPIQLPLPEQPIAESSVILL